MLGGALLLSLGCGGATDRAPRHAELPGRVVAAPPPVESPPEPAGAVVLLPGGGGGEALEVGRDPDGATHYLLGGARITALADGAHAVAAGWAATWLRAIRLPQGRWVFVGSDGLVAASESFGGPLVRVGDLAAGPRIVGRSGDRALVWSGGALYATDGRAQLARSEPAPPEPLREALIDDAGVGAATTHDGRVLVTVDAGARWAAARPGAHALGLERDGARVVVQTVDGFRAVSARGGLMPVRRLVPRDAEGPASDTPVDEATTRALMDATESRAQGVLRAGGGMLVARGRDVVEVDAVSGAVRRTHAGVLPEPGCRLESWGARVAAHCVAGLFHSDDGSTFVRLAELPAWPNDWREAHARLDADGVHVVTLTQDCAGGHSRRWCVIARGSRAREVDDPGGWSLIAVHHGVLLLGHFRSPDEEGSKLALLSTRDGTLRALELPPEVTTDYPHLEASWTADGQVVVVERPPGMEARALLIGDAARGLALARRTVPTGAQAIGMMDATHGVAVGIDTAHLWETSDGARTWRPIAGIAARGRPIALRREDEPYVIYLRCGARHCLARSVLANLLFLGSSRFAAAGEAPIATNAPRERWALARLDCGPAGEEIDAPIDTTDAPAFGGVEAAVDATGTTVGVEWGLGGAIRESNPTRLGRGRVLRDEDFSATSGGATLLGLITEPRVLAASESHIVIRSCLAERDCRLLFARAEGPVRELRAYFEATPWLAGADARGGILGQACFFLGACNDPETYVPFPQNAAVDGDRTLLHYASWDDSVRVQELVELDGDGRTVASRRLAGGDGTLMLARTHDGARGLAVSTAADPRALLLFRSAAGPGIPLRRARDVRLTACRGPTPPDADTLWSGSVNGVALPVEALTTDAAAEDEIDPWNRRAQIELSADGSACVRTVELGMRGEDGWTTWQLGAAPDGGGFTGLRTEGARARGWRCQHTR